jgi:hypothetical protein
MRKHFTLPLIGCLLLTSLALAAPRDDLRIPHRYTPGALDQGLVQVAAPDGRIWAAWAYRNGAEYDIAVAVRDTEGIWSEPSLIGLDDGRSQIRPSLAVDADGNLYLAFAERRTGRILLTTRTELGAWAAPVAMTSPGSRSTSPRLQVVGSRLVLAFSTGDNVEILDLPLATPDRNGDEYLRGFTDGPDPVGTPGDSEDEEPTPEGEEGVKQRDSVPMTYEGSSTSTTRF